MKTINSLQFPYILTTSNNTSNCVVSPPFVHIITTGTTPSITAGAGPTISSTGTDTSGYITLTPAGSPGANAIVATITF